MRGVTKTTKISLSLTAEDWELFTYTMDCTGVAEAINKGVEKAINEATSAREAAGAGYAVLRKYADYGALDSEPLRCLDRIIEEVFE